LTHSICFCNAKTKFVFNGYKMKAEHILIALLFVSLVTIAVLFQVYKPGTVEPYSRQVMQDSGIGMDAKPSARNAHALAAYRDGVLSGKVDAPSHYTVTIPRYAGGREVPMPASLTDSYGAVVCRLVGDEWKCEVSGAGVYSGANEDPGSNDIRNRELHNEEIMILGKLLRSVGYQNSKQ